MQKAILFFLLITLISSCKTLTSTTTIKANDSFILGKNEHGSFTLKMKNISSEPISIFHAPIDGGSYSHEVVKPSKTKKVKVEKNTALIIENKSNKEVSVELLVKGDIGLSMTYKN